MKNGDIITPPAAGAATVAPAMACPVCGALLPPGVREEFCPACLLGGSAGTAVAGTGRVLGDCEIFEEIGRGGMGVVWRGRQRGLNRDVAVKTLPGGDFAGAEARARFKIEAQAAARLNHPNIVSIHDVGEDDGMPYFVMELVTGRTLAAVCADSLPPPRTAAAWVQRAALAVQHAHEQGVLHRDLKPSNIIIETDAAGGVGRTRVMDFGLAKLTDTESGFTLSGSAAGSPAYMAPEMVCGGAATAQGDVYGLGAVLYTALTGRAPFSGDSVAAVLAQVEREEPLPPRRLVPSVPRDLETICLKCLEKNPAQRYAGAALLAADIGRFLNGEPVLARPVAWPGKLTRWAARRPALAAALVLTFLALAATAVISSIAAVRIARERSSAEAAASAAARTTMELHGQEASRRMEQGDIIGALPSLVAALQAEEDDPARIRTHAVRLATAISECPRLLNLWYFGTQIFHSKQAPGNVIIPKSVLAADFSPDGRWLACANGWHTYIFNLETPSVEDTRLPNLQEKERPAWVAFNADSRRLLAGTLTGQLTLWDLEKRQPIVSGLAHRLGTPCTYTFFRPVMNRAGSRLVRAESGSGQKSGLWVVKADETTGTEGPNQTRLWEGARVTALALSKDEQCLAAGNANGEIRLWDFTTLQPAGPGWKIAGAVRRLDFSPDGKRLAVVCGTHTAQIHHLPDGALLGTPIQHEGYCYQALFSPDGTLMATASYGGNSTHVLEGATGRLKYTLRTEVGTGSALFSPDGTKLLTTGWDGTGQLWASEDGKLLSTVAMHGGRNFAAAFSPDGRRVFTGGRDGIARLWELPLPPPPVGEIRASTSAHGRYAATREPRTVTLQNKALSLLLGREPSATAYPVIGYSIATNQPVGKFPPGAGYVGGYSDNGFIMLCADGMFHIRRWDAPSGAAPLASFPRAIQPTDKEAFSAVSPDGRCAIVSRESRTFSLHDITRSDCPVCGTFTLPGKFEVAAWSPDGTLAAFASTAGANKTKSLTLIRLKDGSTAATIRTLTDTASLAFSPDSRWLAWGGYSISDHGVCLVYDTTGAQVCPGPILHQDNVTAVAFSPDGRTLAMGGRDRIIRLIDTRNWQPGAAPLKLTSEISHISFSRDGHWIVGTDARSHTRVWDVATSQPITPSLLIAPRAETSWLTDDSQTLIAVGSGLSSSMATRSLAPGPASSLSVRAELLSGHRMDPVAGLVPIPQEELLAMWEQEKARRAAVVE